MKCKIAAQTIHARFERSGELVKLTLEAPQPSALAALFELHPEIQFEVCPLALADGQLFRSLREITSEGIAFEQMTMAQVGAFVMIQLTHPPTPTQRVKRFAVKATTEMDDGFWDERRVAFLKENLNSRDFREFLRSILFGDALGRPDVGPIDDENGNAARQKKTRSRSLLDDYTVEDILHACTADRSKIEDIDRLLKALEGTDKVDAPFLEFWANFREAVRSTEEVTRA